MNTPSLEAVTIAVGSVQDPALGRALSDTRMVESVNQSDSGTFQVKIALPAPGWPNVEELEKRISEAVESQGGTAEVETTVNTLGMESGGRIGLRVKNVIAVGSGKGGVGKSTLAAAIAYGLKHYGAKVGLMDADVYGPSIPHMVNAIGQPTMSEYKLPNGEKVQKIDPIEVDGLKVMSMAFFIEKDQAVVWRGPMLHKAIGQFLQDTDWGDLDYLIIDMPPGTGDVSLTPPQLIGLAGGVVVCTPQEVALLDAVKAVAMMRQVKIPVLGIVENMTGDIFGIGGARKKAEELGIPYLGEIPAHSSIRVQGDEGHIGQLFENDNETRDALLNVTQNVAVEIARQVLDSAKMPDLEVL